MSVSGDANAYIQDIERAKRILLLTIDSDVRVPELERQIALRAINQAVNDIVRWKVADAERRHQAMIRRAA